MPNAQMGICVNWVEASSRACWKPGELEKRQIQVKNLVYFTFILAILLVSPAPAVLALRLTLLECVFKTPTRQELIDIDFERSPIQEFAE
jgi:hypothetical protein